MEIKENYPFPLRMIPKLGMSAQKLLYYIVLQITIFNLYFNDFCAFAKQKSSFLSNYSNVTKLFWQLLFSGWIIEQRIKLKCYLWLIQCRRRLSYSKPCYFIRKIVHLININ